MALGTSSKLPWWAWVWPSVAWLTMLLAIFVPIGVPLALIGGLILFATVFAAVYHAEVVAHRLGEPFGTFVLAVAVTVIEVALIISVILSAPEAKAALARDTVFAAVMIVCNGIVGVSLLVGGVRHHEQGFQIQGASAALAVLAVLTTMTLVLPSFTSSAPGPRFSSAQLAFAGIVSLILYVSFLFVQTIRHRDYFLPEDGGSEESHAPPPTSSMAMLSFGLLVLALIAVVGLAKLLTPSLERVLDAAAAPKGVIGIVIAGLVLLPEGLAALRAAKANRLQTSLNLALGSALASIGLTIPAVAVLALALGLNLELGLGTKDQIMLALTVFLSVITLSTGRTTVLQGIVHLVIFASFLFFAVVP